MDLMLDLNGRRRVLFESNWRCTIKWKRECTCRFTWVKYENDSAVEVVLMVLLKTHLHLSKLKIKGAPAVPIGFHLKMNIVVHFQVQRSSQNNSIKRRLDRQSMLHLKLHLRLHFKKHKKFQRYVKK